MGKEKFMMNDWESGKERRYSYEEEAEGLAGWLLSKGDRSYVFDELDTVVSEATCEWARPWQHRVMNDSRISGKVMARSFYIYNIAWYLDQGKRSKEQADLLAVFAIKVARTGKIYGFEKDPFFEVVRKTIDPHCYLNGKSDSIKGGNKPKAFISIEEGVVAAIKDLSKRAKVLE